MKGRFRRELKTLGWAALVLFLAVAFAVTLSIMIFLQSIDFTPEELRSSAPQTLLMVLNITGVFIIAYIIIRYITVIRPLKKIQRVLDQIAIGDFSERLPESGLYGNFALIAENINRMADELASSALMKTDFISNVSHELKTPLAVIQNYGRLLQEEGLSETEREEYARAITQSTAKMNELITNILRLNRLENQTVVITRTTFDLGAQLTDCLLQFENVWEEKNIDLDVNLIDGIQIESDAELLCLVWNNLLSNAFKFTDAGGTVRLTLKESANYASVTVADTGEGMTSETARHIFDKFYQGDTSRATQGNGLGLALVMRVMDKLGGEISVSSKPGDGSAFSVKLPKRFPLSD